MLDNRLRSPRFALVATRFPPRANSGRLVSAEAGPRWRGLPRANLLFFVDVTLAIEMAPNFGKRIDSNPTSDILGAVLAPFANLPPR
eukprot:1023843-Pyramimonas_sp.AAC.1